MEFKIILTLLIISDVRAESKIHFTGLHQEIDGSFKVDTLGPLTFSVDPDFYNGELVDSVDCFLNGQSIASLANRPYVCNFSVTKGGFNSIKIAITFEGQKVRKEIKIFPVIQEGAGDRAVMLTPQNETNQFPTPTNVYGKPHKKKSGLVWLGVGAGLFLIGDYMVSQGRDKYISAQAEIKLEQQYPNIYYPHYNSSPSQKLDSATGMIHAGQDFKTVGGVAAGIGVLEMIFNF